MKKLFPIFLVAFIALFATCKHEPEILLNGNGNPNDTTNHNPNPPPSYDSVCFNTQILPLFLSNCAQAPGCHTASNPADGIALTNYAQIKARISKSMSEINKGKMPEYPYPKLDTASINLLNRWIKEGSKNRICTPQACDTANVKYSTHIVPVVNLYCKGCHSASTAASSGGGIKLDTYADMKANTMSPGKVICTIKASGCTLMPKNGTSIGTCNIRKIQIWAAANYPQ